MAKILVVDDSKLMQKMVGDVLTGAGYAVAVASDGEEALALVASEKPNLIILDLMLPKIDGHKVCAMLKHNEQYKAIPIIMFTAKIDDEVMASSQEAGADDHLTKDFKPDQLLGLVKKYLP